MKKLISAVLVIVMLAGVLAMAGCEAEETHVFEIKLYDATENESRYWNLVPSEQWETFQFIYDGKPKVFHAKTFICGEELSQFNSGRNLKNNNRQMVVFCDYVGGEQFQAPIEKGKYLITYMLTELGDKPVMLVEKNIYIEIV